MIQPYYEQDGITIYHGDCREVLPALPIVDAIVTDPPYGIDHGNAGGAGAKHGWASRVGAKEWDKHRPDAETLRVCVEHGRYAMVWGGNYFTDALPIRTHNKWLIWDKCQTDFSLADCEMAWCSWDGAIRRLAFSRGAALRDGKQHPTQKPEAVMAWALNQLPNGVRTLADPFMGSGTTLVEGKRRGFSAYGIEREERYCEIAAKRLAQGALPLDVAG
jgi:DNA modification methylase